MFCSFDNDASANSIINARPGSPHCPENQFNQNMDYPELKIQLWEIDNACPVQFFLNLRVLELVQFLV